MIDKRRQELLTRVTLALGGLVKLLPEESKQIALVAVEILERQADYPTKPVVTDDKIKDAIDQAKKTCIIWPFDMRPESIKKLHKIVERLVWTKKRRLANLYTESLIRIAELMSPEGGGNRYRQGFTFHDIDNAIECAMMRLRRGVTRHEQILDVNPQLLGCENQDIELLEFQDWFGVVSLEIARMPGGNEAISVLKDEMSTKQMAEILNCSPTKARDMCHRVLGKLNKRWSEI